MNILGNFPGISLKFSANTLKQLSIKSLLVLAKAMKWVVAGKSGAQFRAKIFNLIQLMLFNLTQFMLVLSQCLNPFGSREI